MRHARIVLVLALLVPLLVLTFTLLDGITVQALNRSQEVYLLAVISENQGVVIKSILWVKIPGSGVFRTRPLFGVGEDTLLSSRLALYYAALLNHANPLYLDAGIVFVNEREVSGASAGLPVTLVYYALLSGKYLNSSMYSATGLFSPNGMVASVGGVIAKINASMSASIMHVLIPLSDYVKYRSAISELEARGATITPVCSIADALSVIFKLPTFSIEFNTSSVMFKEAASQLLRLLNESITRYNISSALRAELAQMVAVARDLYIRGYYYSSASEAYAALVTLIEHLDAASLRDLTERILGSMNRELFAERMYAVKVTLSKSRKLPLWHLEGVIAADYRLYAAAKLMSKSEPRLRALGALRLLTAYHWLNASSQVEGPLIDANVFRNAVKILVQYADLASNYLEAIAEEKGVSIRNAEMIPLSELRSDMNTALLSGDYIRAAAIALNIIGLVSNSIVAYDATVGADPDQLLKCALKQVMLHEYTAGATSFAANMLMEYALHAPSNLTRAVIADQAASHTLLLLALAASANTPFYTAELRKEATSDLRLYLALVAASVLGSITVAAGVALLREKIE